MALTRKKATTIALDPEDDRLLSRAAQERGVSRSSSSDSIWRWFWSSTAGIRSLEVLVLFVD